MAFGLRSGPSAYAAVEELRILLRLLEAEPSRQSRVDRPRRRADDRLDLRSRREGMVEDPSNSQLAAQKPDRGAEDRLRSGEGIGAGFIPKNLDISLVNFGIFG